MGKGRKAFKGDKMNLGTKLRLKRDWKISDYLTDPKGEIMNVCHYDYKYGLTLAHPQIRGTFNFNYSPHDREELLSEYFEEVKENCSTCEFKSGNICVNMNNTLMNCDESINVDDEFCCSRYSEKQDEKDS